MARRRTSLTTIRTGGQGLSKAERGVWAARRALGLLMKLKRRQDIGPSERDRYAKRVVALLRLAREGLEAAGLV